MRIFKFIIVLIIGFHCFTTKASENIVINKGVLDLRGYDINKIEPIKFSGEWEFYWDVLISPNELQNMPKKSFIYVHVPSVWHEYIVDGKKLPHFGKGTYRIRILVDDVHQKLGMKLGGMGSAFKLIVDGTVLHSSGKVAANKRDEVPSYNPGVVTFYPKTDTVDVMIQISNFNQANGGIWDTYSKIGSESNVLTSWDNDIQISILFIGCFLIFALYHLSLYFLSRKFKYTLYFSLFCGIIILRTLVVNEIYLLSLFPNFSWAALIRIEYLTLILGVIAFTLFIYKFFSDEYSDVFLRIILGISAVFAAIILFTPPSFFTEFLVYYQINILLCSAYIVYVVTKALRRKRQSAIILLIGFVVLFAAVANDILYANRLIDTMFLTSIGFVLFIFSQSYMLSARYSSLLVETESLSQRLEATNVYLEKLVDKRTVKIQQQNNLLNEQSSEILAKKAVLEQKNNEIKLQRDELKRQNLKVNNQKQQITHSIEYAAKIQEVVLDSTKDMRNVAPDSFFIFHPKDIVSGDFYWFREIELEGKKIRFGAVVDCTGHGVPGALMSIMGAMFLNKIAGELKQIPQASDILNLMRIEVKKILRQYASGSAVRDGMEMALCVMDYDAMQLQFAGAHSPLFIIRASNDVMATEVEEYKGDNMPVGIYVKEKESFTNYLINVNKGDLVYMFSDGYYDQFGGEFGKKLKKESFKTLLLKNAHLPTTKQKLALELELLKWQGKYDQIDDITVLGIRV